MGLFLMLGLSEDDIPSSDDADVDPAIIDHRNEVLGEDQAKHLLVGGVDSDRLVTAVMLDA